MDTSSGIKKKFKSIFELLSQEQKLENAIMKVVCNSLTTITSYQHTGFYFLCSVYCWYYFFSTVRKISRDSFNLSVGESSKVPS